MDAQPAPETPAPAVPAPSPASGTRPAAKPQHWSIAWLLRLAILVIAGGIVVLLATRWDTWVGDRSRQTTDDAYARGDITPLSAQVEGYVNSVPVKDFQ